MPTGESSDAPLRNPRGPRLPELSKNSDPLFAQFFRQAMAAQRDPFEQKLANFRPTRTRVGRNEYQYSEPPKFRLDRDRFVSDINRASNDYFTQQGEQARQSQQQRMDALAAERQAAMSQFEQQQQLLREQANRALSAPPAPPETVGSIAPLEAITGVSLDPNLRGTSASSGAFYIAPESTQSQFAVGAPISGGIPNRQRGTTDNIAGQRSDTLGSQRKDEL